MTKFLLALLFVPAVILGGDHSLPWQANKKLTWDDFQGPIDHSSDMSAHTTSRINYKWACNEGVFEVEVESAFDRSRSWVKEWRTDGLLAHEQLHFDITEWFARKLRKTLEGLEDACHMPSEEIKAKANKIRKEWKATQDQYDRDADHGRYHEGQVKWEERVGEEMEALEEFASVAE